MNVPDDVLRASLQKGEGKEGNRTGQGKELSEAWSQLESSISL